jgi:hypothetical protein
MKNKNILLLPLFLLLSTATRCMEIITTEPIIIKNLKKEREKIRQIFINPHYNFSNFGIPEKSNGPIFTNACMLAQMAKNKKALFLSYIYFYKPKLASKKIDADRFTINCLKTDKILLKICQSAHTKELHSIASTPDKHWVMTSHSHHLLQCSALGITAASHLFVKKQREIIKQLLALGFTPTKDDKKMAMLKLWEKYFPIMKEIPLFKYTLNNALIPDDVIYFIYQLMIDTELLF